MLTIEPGNVDNTSGMMKPRKRSLEIRSFLLDRIAQESGDVTSAACERFGLSRQAINRHMTALVDQTLVVASGKTKGRAYKLAILSSDTVEAPIQGLQEDALWRKSVVGLLPSLPQNVLDIWHYGFTEMVNNAIDHSGGTIVTITIERTAVSTTMWIQDDGVGIFRKIHTELHLEDERHAVLELAKGKLTTDPEHHTGEGIFFSSRMFELYAVLSGGVQFSHQFDQEGDWILELAQPANGTFVYMSIRDHSLQKTETVFDKFTSKNGSFDFSRTVVPVRLLKHGAEQLISRSQAKRLLARFDRFQVVILDFNGVDEIGRAFADEIFRVFPAQNPEVKIVPTGMKPKVKRMVALASRTASEAR